MAEGERGFLGLTHNPFTDENDHFFEGGDRKTHLDQLRHLSQWSRRILLVTGPQGVGKTALFRQLSMTLEARVKAARINGMLVNSARDVMLSTAQGFGAPAPGDGNLQLLSNVVTTFVINQDRQGRFCLAMVDDAHLLDFQALEELLKLSKTCPVRVLLFGEPSIVGMVAKCADRHEVSWHEMRLTGFSAGEIRKYLEWRFEQAKYRGRLPFGDDQVNRIAKLSGGLPREINRIGAELLERLESGQGKSRRFPTAHRVLILMLFVLVGGAYFVFRDMEESEEAPTVADVTPIELPTVVQEPEEEVEAITPTSDEVPDVVDEPTEVQPQPTEIVEAIDEPEPEVQQPSVAVEEPEPATVVPVEESAPSVAEPTPTPTPTPSSPAARVRGMLTG